MLAFVFITKEKEHIQFINIKLFQVKDNVFYFKSMNPFDNIISKYNSTFYRFTFTGDKIICSQLYFLDPFNGKEGVIDEDVFKITNPKVAHQFMSMFQMRSHM